jgi:two-component system phosphate regulon sensor histidine kinase PhoR
MKYVALRADQSEQAATIVRVALPLDHLEEQLADLRRLVWTAVAITALAALFLAFILARCITRPIQELTEGVARASAGDFGKRVYPLSRDEVGTLARAFNEMSERLATQFRQLEEDRQQLRAVLSGMVEGVVALDVEQRIVFANERATQLLDFPMPAAIGRRLWEVVRQRPLQDLVERALAGSESASQELSWNNPAARSLTVHVAQFAGSSMRGAVLVLHDTSELRRLERLRQDFVANVSHELKTPLAVIKAAVETLLDGAVEDAANRGAFLEQIADQSERLHALILDLLSLARIEAGTEAFEFQAVALGPLVADCVERHRARAEARGQLLRIAGCGLQFDQGKPQAATHKPQWGVAWADEEAVTQILDNLVDNALKYTPEGGQITIRWGESDGQACLEVEDTGIGIPERDLSRIFERFYRVDKARSRELGGTGLGLAIVKHLVQAMNGSIRARSQLGKGTIFSVWLPREPAV